MGPIFTQDDLQRLERAARPYMGRNGEIPTVKECAKIARTFNRGAKDKRSAQSVRVKLLRLTRGSSKRIADMALAGAIWELRTGVARAKAHLARAERKLAEAESLRGKFLAVLNDA